MISAFLVVTLSTLCVTAQGTTISPLPDGRNFVFPGEKITYTCTGPGTQLDWFAPPVVEQNFIGFFSTSAIGTRLTRGPLSATLLSTSSGILVSEVRVTPGSDLVIICATGELGKILTDEVRINHTFSQFPDPLPENSIFFEGFDCLNENVLIGWLEPSNPRYDLDCYVIEIFEESVLKHRNCIIDTFYRYDLKENTTGVIVNIQVKVSIRNLYNQTSNSTMSRSFEITIQQPTLGTTTWSSPSESTLGTTTMSWSSPSEPTLGLTSSNIAVILLSITVVLSITVNVVLAVLYCQKKIYAKKVMKDPDSTSKSKTDNLELLLN